jgi:ATP-dependent DNA ligase
MERRLRTAIPDDPLDWRPQVPVVARRSPTVRDPVVEPMWSGTRVIAHFEANEQGRVRRLVLIDEDGFDVSKDEPEVLDELGRSVLAFDAVIDGILTVQATRGGEGASVIPEAHVTAVGMLLGRDATIDIERPEAERPGVVAFVALDLLRLDGQTLFDLPLLERKRLLEGTLKGGDLVRVSPFTRPPAAPWVASWKSAGFRGAMLKGANSRYEPGGESADWAAITRIDSRR